MIKSFLGLPNKFLEDRLFADYVIRSAYNEGLLRSPAHSELSYWRPLLKSFGIMEFVRQLQFSPEKSALNAKIDSQRIIFMHIPKTAGSSLRAFFKRFTNNVYTHQADENPCPAGKACFINGHFGFSFMKNTTYDHSFTILRDPIERIISLYRFGRYEGSDWMIDDPVRTLNFNQWLSSDNPDVRTQIDSFYVRIITDDIAEPFENRVAESLQMAFKRYSDFSAIGDQSNLKPFCKKVASLLGIPIFSMPSHNIAEHYVSISNNYPLRPKLTPEVQRRLGQLTRFDYEVYNRFRAK